MTTAEDLGIRGLDDVESLDIDGSRVLRAHQPSHNRYVAVKILDQLQEPLVPRRFDPRRKALNRFADTGGVVPVYGTGTTAQGHDYLMMPYFRIGSLADQMAHGPMPWHRACELVVKAAEIVARGHDLGVVLGDLKPSSILLADAGSPMIAVYGMATRRFDDGSPSYQAPELAPGVEPTMTADVYSLCLLLGATIAGRPPSRGGLSREFQAEVAELAPQRIVDIVERGTADSPNQRYVNAGQFAVALAGALAEPMTGQIPAVGTSALDFDLDELLGPPGELGGDGGADIVDIDALLSEPATEDIEVVDLTGADIVDLTTKGDDHPDAWGVTDWNDAGWDEHTTNGHGTNGHGTNGHSGSGHSSNGHSNNDQRADSIDRLIAVTSAAEPPADEVAAPTFLDDTPGVTASAFDVVDLNVPVDDVLWASDAEPTGEFYAITPEDDRTAENWLGPEPIAAGTSILAPEPPISIAGRSFDPVTADDDLPFRAFDRQHVDLHSQGRLSFAAEVFQTAWYNGRRSLGALLAIAGFAAIAAIVGVLAYRDLAASEPATSSSSTSEVPAPTIPPAGPVAVAPTSEAPALVEPPSTHLDSTIGRSATTTAAVTETTAPASTAAETTEVTEAPPTTEATTPPTEPPATTRLTTTTRRRRTTATPEGPTVPLIDSAGASRVRATTARVSISSPSCVTATFVYGPVGGTTGRSTTSSCNTSHTLLLGVVTPSLSPGTAYEVRVTVNDAKTGASSSRTVGFTTLS